MAWGYNCKFPKDICSWGWFIVVHRQVVSELSGSQYNLSVEIRCDLLFILLIFIGSACSSLRIHVPCSRLKNVPFCYVLLLFKKDQISIGFNKSNSKWAKE
uniref:Uncharacterized protein n=1 Tax=Helianthus annuus TaxID=4232 RepID=A0A251UWP5_HELAN